MAHAKMRSVAVAIAVVTVTLVGAITPRGAQGATQRQAAVPTVNPGTFNYSLLALPSWALPAGPRLLIPNL